VKSYLGLLTYYGKLLPNLATLLAPLHLLLRKGVVWRWGSSQKGALSRCSRLLLSYVISVLIYHLHASAYGIGPVLAHRLSDGSEKPIAYALSQAEQNNSQLEKEGLACIFGVKKFYAYLFGHH
jgi:hypothetical protein